MKVPNIRLSAKILKKHKFEINHNDLPSKLWHNSIGFLHLEAMKIKNGYWIIITMRQSGEESGRINLGRYLYEHELIKLVEALGNFR